MAAAGLSLTGTAAEPLMYFETAASQGFLAAANEILAAAGGSDTLSAGASPQVLIDLNGKTVNCDVPDLMASHGVTVIF